MPDSATVRDLLARYAEETFSGRSKELAFLSQALEKSTPPVSFVYGIGGIGKSRLLEAFTRHARGCKAFVVGLDCRHFEPTPSGFLRELGAAVGADVASVGEASHRLGQIPQRVILVLDSYEVLRLLDTWLRQDFVPSLPNNAHMILCGGKRRKLLGYAHRGGAVFFAVWPLRHFQKSNPSSFWHFQIFPKAERATSTTSRVDIPWR